MKAKLRDINKKNLVMTFLSFAVLVLLYFSVGYKKQVEVVSVSIKINKLNAQKNLISKKDVVMLFRGYLGYDLRNATIEELDLNMLEKILLDDSRVKRAEVFIDAHKVVNVYIKQRKPIVRVNSGEAFSYYLDDEGVVVPVEKGNPIRVPIATGNIEGVNEGLSSKGNSNLKRIFQVASFVEKDVFLRSLVEQIHVKDDGSIMIIPKLGREKIAFGRVKDMKSNFKKLKDFYRNGLSKNGWDQFAELNLNYKGQIVALQR